jgi:hypothetical protein
MPQIFQARIRHVRLTFSPFSSEQFHQIGSVMLDTITSRIRSGVNAQDSPAKPLNPAYAKRKLRRNRSPIRDWSWRGFTLGSAKVKVASEDSVTIGFINAQANLIATVNNRIEKAWGESPRDREIRIAVIRAALTQNVSRSVRKSA